MTDSRDSKSTDISVSCPTCGARLVIDTSLGQVIAHEAPSRHQSHTDLDRAETLLQERAARREEIFRQSTESEKMKSRLLERKFEEALEKTKREPVDRPTRDIDLD